MLCRCCALFMSCVCVLHAAAAVLLCGSLYRVLDQCCAAEQEGKIDKRHGDPDAGGKNSGQKAVCSALSLSAVQHLAKLQLTHFPIMQADTRAEKYGEKIHYRDDNE